MPMHIKIKKRNCSYTSLSILYPKLFDFPKLFNHLKYPNLYICAYKQLFLYMLYRYFDQSTDITILLTFIQKFD